jgi:hypothetical protein
MRLRIAISIIILCLYVGLFNLYIYELTKIDIKSSKLFYNCLTLGAIVFFLIDSKAGFVNIYHKQFNFLLILCVIVNYIIIILTHYGILDGNRPIPVFYSFNGSVFAITLIIFERSIKYKVFNE